MNKYQAKRRGDQRQKRDKRRRHIRTWTYSTPIWYREGVFA